MVRLMLTALGYGTAIYKLSRSLICASGRDPAAMRFMFSSVPEAVYQSSGVKVVKRRLEISH